MIWQSVSIQACPGCVLVLNRKALIGHRGVQRTKLCTQRLSPPRYTVHTCDSLPSSSPCPPSPSSPASRCRLGRPGTLDIHQINTGPRQCRPTHLSRRHQHAARRRRRRQPPTPRYAAEARRLPHTGRMDRTLHPPHAGPRPHGHARLRLSDTLPRRPHGQPCARHRKPRPAATNSPASPRSATLIPIKLMLDRGWPDYNYPAPLNDATVANYRAFLE